MNVLDFFSAVSEGDLEKSLREKIEKMVPENSKKS